MLVQSHPLQNRTTCHSGGPLWYSTPQSVQAVAYTKRLRTLSGHTAGLCTFTPAKANRLPLAGRLGSAIA